MLESLGPLFNLYQFTSGRIIFAAGLVTKEAGTLENPGVVEACNAAAEAGQQALKAQDAWNRTKAASTARGDGKAVILDRQIDRTISGILRAAQNNIQSLDPASDLVAKARQLVKMAFPGGAEAVTKLAHEDELAAVKTLRARFDDENDLKPYIEPLGLTALIGRLDELIPAFAAALADQSGGEITFDKVESRRLHKEQLQEVTRQVMTSIARMRREQEEFLQSKA